jgi:hypothetical protein
LEFPLHWAGGEDGVIVTTQGTGRKSTFAVAWTTERQSSQQRFPTLGLTWKGRRSGLQMGPPQQTTRKNAGKTDSNDYSVGKCNGCNGCGGSSQFIPFIGAGRPKLFMAIMPDCHGDSFLTAFLVFSRLA